MDKQIFFLLLISGFLGGLCLSSNHVEERIAPLTNFLNTKLVKMILALVLFAVAIAGFIFHGDSVPFLSDLLPLSCSILVSATLAYEVFKEAYPGEVMSKPEEVFSNIFVKHRTTLGIVQMMLMVVHFFAESVILL